MRPLIYDGSEKPPPAPILLKAGALSLIYEAGMLRGIRVGSTEVVRGIYAAVRDQNWNTIAGELHDVAMDIQPDSFRIAFTSDHQQNDIHFVWKGLITGEANSTVTFSFDGEALTTFKRNRIGFCVLHPMEVAGQACDIEHTNGQVEHGMFPKDIAPHQPYFDIRAMTHDVLPGVRAEVRMEGDTFEIEDQRNWIDASYKTYCTPLALPYPALVEKGATIRQKVTVKLVGETTGISITESEPALTPAVHALPLPPIGLGLTTVLTGQDENRLRALKLSHLRVDLYPGADNIPDSPEIPLELAVHVGENVERDIQNAAQLIKHYHRPIARILVFEHRKHFAHRDMIEKAKRALDKFAPFGSGTDAFFTELNRNRPPADLLDWVSYSINPQVHAFDNASLVETLLAMGETVESARQFSGSAKIAVSPVTLKIRWHPNATTPEAPLPAGQPPHSYDPRQKTLFGAAWTLGSIQSLAHADSLTFYETSGWLGVMDGAQVFPMYHVFADVGEFAGGEIQPLTSAHPLVYGGFVLRKAGKTRVMLANYTDQPQTVLLNGLSGQFATRSLDETTAETAVRDPEKFRAQTGTPLSDSRIMLLPYAVVCLNQF